VPAHLVELAGDGAEVRDLQVLGERELDLVDVRELVAFGVDAPEERVPLQRPDRVLIGVTVRQADTTGSSGLSAQLYLALSCATQLSKPPAFALASTSGVNLGRNCLT
jgi:hypothetical protein